MKLFFAFFFLVCFSVAFAQQDTTIPPYKRYPTVPTLQLLTMDSTLYTKTNLPKKKQVLLMLFSPDCDHCQHEAEQLEANREAFRTTQIVMVSTAPLYRLKDFAETYKLNKMDNVVVAKDPYYLLLSFFGVHNFPYLALYNKKGNLIKTFEGSVKMETLLQAFRNAP